MTTNFDQTMLFNITRTVTVTTTITIPDHLNTGRGPADV